MSRLAIDSVCCHRPWSEMHKQRKKNRWGGGGGAIDYFCPLTMKYGKRARIKAHGVIFSCRTQDVLM